MLKNIFEFSRTTISLLLLLLLRVHDGHEGDVALLEHDLLLVDGGHQLLDLLLDQLGLAGAELGGLLGLALHEVAGAVLDEVVLLALSAGSCTSRSLSICPGT